MQDFTPFNPCPQATALVTRSYPVLPTLDECNVCGSDQVHIASNDIVYGKQIGHYPWIYICSNCNSYVGIHKNTRIPLGTLADMETRSARIESKLMFRRWIEINDYKTSQAYIVLARKMGIARGDCHFGMFDKDQCERAKLVFQGVEVNT